MKAMIDKEEKTNGMIFHAGVLTDDNNIDFDFTLVEMYDKNSDSSSFEITFCDTEPSDIKSAEKVIMIEFNKI